MTRLIPIMCLIAMMAGCSDTGSLDDAIAARKKDLESVEREIGMHVGEPFQTTHDVQVALSVAKIGAWFQRTSTPESTISAQGLNSSGYLVYKPNVGKAWLKPAHNAELVVTLSGLNAKAVEGRVIWSGQVTAHAEARARTDIVNSKRTAVCAGDLPKTDFSGRLLLEPGAPESISYTLLFTHPSTIDIRATCRLGKLGNYEIPMSEVIAKLAEGKLPLTLMSEGDISIPDSSSATMYHYTLSPDDASLRPDETHIRVASGAVRYHSDIIVTVKKADTGHDQ